MSIVAVHNVFPAILVLSARLIVIASRTIALMAAADLNPVNLAQVAVNLTAQVIPGDIYKYAKNPVKDSNEASFVPMVA